jgi:hypothetical protein
MQHGDEEARIEALVEQFAKAAKLYFEAWGVHDFKRQDEGIEKAYDAATALDALGTGHRMTLVRLLDSDDVELRVVAATCLRRVMPDRALSILRKIDETDLGLPALAAMHTLFDHENGGTPV